MPLRTTKVEREAFPAAVHVGIVSVADPGREDACRSLQPLAPEHPFPAAVD